MRFFWLILGWCTVLVLIVSWFMYLLYDYDVTGQ